MEENYLESVKKLFRSYKKMGEKAMAQLDEKDLFWSYNEHSNSVAVLVKHLWGNMLSRWTDFLTTDGEKDWRSRDGEFEADINSREELMSKWEEGWNCLFDALNSVDQKNFESVVYIRKVGHTVVEAINRQLAHYCCHIGQIVYIARMIKAERWESLSVPKGASEKFNKEQFSKPKTFYSEYSEKLAGKRGLE